MKSFDCKACKVSADRSIFLTNLFKKLSRNGKERTSEGTLLSRRMVSARFPTPGNTWDHILTFTLSEGTQVELFTDEARFSALKEGQTGILTWEGENLLRFEPQE